MKTKNLALFLVILFAVMACENYTPQENKQKTYVDNLISQSQELGTEGAAQNLLGTWKQDSIFTYDDDWQTIKETIMLEGDIYYMGLALSEFSFTADGKCQESIKSVALGFEGVDEYIVEFDWSYDAETHTLTLINNQGYKREYKVSGINCESLILDYYDTVNCHNTRQVYKRKIE